MSINGTEAGFKADSAGHLNGPHTPSRHFRDNLHTRKESERSLKYAALLGTNSYTFRKDVMKRGGNGL